MLTVNSFIHMSCFLQEGCCGAHNYTDYARLNDWKKRDAGYPNAIVPLSCCKKNTTEDTPYSMNDLMDLSKCLQGELANINSQVSEITALTELVTAYVTSRHEQKYADMTVECLTALCHHTLLTTLSGIP